MRVSRLKQRCHDDIKFVNGQTQADFKLTSFCHFPTWDGNFQIKYVRKWKAYVHDH